MSIRNDGVHDTFINACITISKDVEKVLATFKINFPEDKNDKKFGRQFFRTSINLEKASNGVNGNFLIKSLMENFYKSFDFELKFPLKKVKNFIIVFYI